MPRSKNQQYVNLARTTTAKKLHFHFQLFHAPDELEMLYILTPIIKSLIQDVMV